MNACGALGNGRRAWKDIVWAGAGAWRTVTACVRLRPSCRALDGLVFRLLALLLRTTFCLLLSLSSTPGSRGAARRRDCPNPVRPAFRGGRFRRGGAYIVLFKPDPAPATSVSGRFLRHATLRCTITRAAAAHALARGPAVPWCGDGTRRRVCVSGYWLTRIPLRRDACQAERRWLDGRKLVRGWFCAPGIRAQDGWVLWLVVWFIVTLLVVPVYVAVWFCCTPRIGFTRVPHFAFTPTVLRCYYCWFIIPPTVVDSVLHLPLARLPFPVNVRCQHLVHICTLPRGSITTCDRVVYALLPYNC